MAAINGEVSIPGTSTNGNHPDEFQWNSCMESMNRIAKLPVVESTVQTATTIYGKVKEYNSLTYLACSTAETAVNKVVEVGKPIAVPIVQGLEAPIKKVDGVLCSGLDYVEYKVPAVKLPPAQMYATTKDFVTQTVRPAVETALEKLEPAVQQAKHVIEPTYDAAKHIVEPLVQPALDTAHAIFKDKIGEYFNCGHKHSETEDDIECEECKKAAKKSEKRSHHQE